jgi:hypothetical protein
MPERQPVCVEELALEAQVVRHPVATISRDREPDRGEMDANLMCATRFEDDLEERVLRQRLDELEVGYRISRLVREPAALERLRSAPDLESLKRVLTAPVASHAA